MKKMLILVILLTGLSCKAEGPFQVLNIVYNPNGCNGTPSATIFVAGGTPPYRLGNGPLQDNTGFGPMDLMNEGLNVFAFSDSSDPNQGITALISKNNSVLGETNVDIRLNCDGTGQIEYNVSAVPENVTINSTLEGPSRTLFGSGPNFNFQNLDAGTHELIITPSSDDPLECQLGIRMFIIIPEFKPLTIKSITTTSLSSPEEGTIRVEVDGGFPPYKYLLELGEKFIDDPISDAKVLTFTVFNAGIYTVTVSDSSRTLSQEECPQTQETTVNPFENPISNRIFLGYCSTGT